jgi:hypothetical protein
MSCKVDIHAQARETPRTPGLLRRYLVSWLIPAAPFVILHALRVLRGDNCSLAVYELHHNKLLATTDIMRSSLCSAPITPRVTTATIQSGFSWLFETNSYNFLHLIYGFIP